jgi:hypothetical protein
VWIEAIAATECGHQSGTVGVVAECGSGAEDHAVDGPETIRQRRPLLDQDGGGLLVGHGHRQASQAQRPGADQCLARPPGGHPEPDRDPVQAQLGEGGVVEERRE